MVWKQRKFTNIEIPLLSVNFDKTIKKKTNHLVVFAYANLHDFRLILFVINILFYFESEQVQEIRKRCFRFKYNWRGKRIIYTQIRSMKLRQFSFTLSFEFNVFSSVLMNVKSYSRIAFTESEIDDLKEYKITGGARDTIA